MSGDQRSGKTHTVRKVFKLRLKHVMKNPELLSGVDAFPALLGEKKSFLRRPFEFEKSLFQSRSLLRRNRLPGKNPAEDPEEIPDDIHMQIEMLILVTAVADRLLPPGPTGGQLRILFHVKTEKGSHFHHAVPPQTKRNRLIQQNSDKSTVGNHEFQSLINLLRRVKQVAQFRMREKSQQILQNQFGIKIIQETLPGIPGPFPVNRMTECKVHPVCKRVIRQINHGIPPALDCAEPDGKFPVRPRQTRFEDQRIRSVMIAF